jgi:hypothetical protein
VNGALEAAGIPTASTGGLVTAPLAVTRGPTDVAALANRLALALAAGLIAVFVHGEAERLLSQELTWRALLSS